MSELTLKTCKIGDEDIGETLPTWRVDIPVWATLRVEAKTKEEAERIVLKAQGGEVAVDPISVIDWNLPEDVSVDLSPVATVSDKLEFYLTSGKLVTEQE